MSPARTLLAKKTFWVSVCTTALLVAAAFGASRAAAETSGAPVGLAAQAGMSQPLIATLSWSAPSGIQIEYYNIYLGWSPTGPFRLKDNTTATSWSFTNGMVGTAYYFRVTAVDAQGGESAPVSAGPVTALWSRSPHSDATAYSTRCAQCHSTHDGGDTLMRLELTADSVSVSCLVCHDGRTPSAANISSGTADSFGLRSGHEIGASKPGRMPIPSCATCHDTHGVAEKTRMIPAKVVNGTAVTQSGNELCVACHDTADSWYGPGYPSTSAPSRDASGYPIAGRWPGPVTYESPTNPHRRIPETTQTVSASTPMRRQQGDCSYCHASHRGANKYDGLKAEYTVVTASTLAADKAQGSSSALCYGCHGGVTPSGFTTAAADIKRFTTGPATAGHNIVTAGGTLPVGASLPCFECHGSHGSERNNQRGIADERGANLRTDNAADVRRFCFTCHTTSDTRAGWDSVQGIYVTVPDTSTVVGLPRAGALLRLPVSGVAHSQTSNQSCYDCHGSSYANGGSNVHSPTWLGAAAAPVTAPLSAIEGLGEPMVAEPIENDIFAPITLADASEAESGTVVLAATDTQSGVAETHYSLDGAEVVTGTLIVTDVQGLHTLEYWSVDSAGNVEAPNRLDFKVDTVAPVTTSDTLTAYDTSATITLEATDGPVGSGVAETFWSLDGSEESTGTVVSTLVGGSHVLRFRSLDVAGNAEATKTVEFTVTGGLPAGSDPTGLGTDTPATQPASPEGEPPTAEPSSFFGLSEWFLGWV